MLKQAHSKCKDACHIIHALNSAARFKRIRHIVECVRQAQQIYHTGNLASSSMNSMFRQISMLPSIWSKMRHFLIDFLIST